VKRGFKKQCEEIAAEVREDLGLRRYDPFDPFSYVEFLDIPCVPISELARDGCSEETAIHLAGAGRKEIFAGTFHSGTRTLIVFNDHNSLARQRSDVAHELAHVLREHEPGPPLGPLGCRVWNGEQEEEAAWLSGVLLVPRPATVRLVRRRTSVEDAANVYGVSVDLMRWRMNVTGAVKQVNREASRRRR
jgi:hypothetical protein